MTYQVECNRAYDESLSSSLRIDDDREFLIIDWTFFSSWTVVNYHADISENADYARLSL